MNDLHTPAPDGPAMSDPVTADEDHILHTHLSAGWLKQAAVYPALSEPRQETPALLDDPYLATRGAGREPEAGQ